MADAEGVVSASGASVVAAPADQPVVTRGVPDQAGETLAAEGLLCTICNLRACWQAPAP